MTLRRPRVVSCLWPIWALVVVVLGWPKQLILPKGWPSGQSVCSDQTIVTGAEPAIMFTPTISEYLFATAAPDRVISGYDANRLVVEQTLLAKAFPSLVSARTRNSLLPGLPSTETLLGRRPTLLLDWSFRAPYFASLGLRSACVIQVHDGADLVTNARTYDRLSGTQYRANELKRRYDEADHTLRADAASTRSRPTVLMIEINRTGVLRANPDRFQSENIARAGGRDLARTIRNSQFNSEALFRLDPDVIVIAPLGAIDEGPDAAAFLRSPQWRSLRAVREGRVYTRPRGASVYFSGLVETPLFTRWLAELFHGDEMQARLRNEMSAAYMISLGFTSSQDELDHALAMTENRLSRGYDRFARWQ